MAAGAVGAGKGPARAPATPAPTATPAPAQTPSSPLVVFNTHSHKYHCPLCKWALRCDKNCVTIPLEEAKKRGGTACKVCGGVCEYEDEKNERD